ncbi:hypothetical protein [Pedobacter gandavensis]|uniref:Aerotolerance regulator N-terminal domain-containing protein n=1 Tax=Pedobacter gandavensis TaxID=2679963 RepID=A0ABR6ETE8_9SPHI|nr:hypothetical protein [Pedobacter gandavensis]MBB2147688.1 hypothetical protein [Pedobacter gandavensis]
MDFKYLAIGICVALGIFLLVMETLRKRKAHLSWRLTAIVVSVVCFYFLLYPPVYTTVKPGGTQDFNLITGAGLVGTGANSKQVATTAKGASLGIDSLNGLSYTLDYQVFMNHKKAGVRFIPDLEYFLKSNPDLQRVHIYGNGLSKDQLRLLKDKQLSFRPGPVTDGLIALNWNAQAKATEPLILQGTYQQAGGASVKLILEGLGANQDSVTISQDGQQHFTLRANPQQSGKAVFHLIGIKGDRQESIKGESAKNNRVAGKDTLFKEPVPIEIKPSKPVKILMLAANPDFEYKFLKNWFFEKQYPLIFRTRISKDKYSTDFLNTDIKEINTISAGLLKKMDLLILDEAELAQLSAAELSNVKSAMEGGLGLFVRLNAVQSTAKSSIGFGTFVAAEASASLKDKTLSGRFSNKTRVFSALPMEQQLFLKPGNNDLPVFQGTQLPAAKILVSTSIYGMGRKTVSTLPATYPWLLNGSAEDYAQFWAEMLHQTARQTQATQTWLMSPAFPKTGESLAISIALPQGGTVPPFKVSNLLMSPLQNRELPTQWQLNTWAAHPGWNTLSVGDVQDSFYVYETSDWQQLSAAQNRLATSQFVKDHPIRTKVLETSILLERKYSLWWFFIPLLLSLSFLWYETKML